MEARSATPGVADLPLKGYIDLIDDQGTILEHKTAGRSYPEDAAAKDIQLTAYSMAYRRLYGKDENGVRMDILVRTKQPKVQQLAAVPAIPCAAVVCPRYRGRASGPAVFLLSADRARPGVNPWWAAIVRPGSDQSGAGPVVIAAVPPQECYRRANGEAKPLGAGGTL